MFSLKFHQYLRLYYLFYLFNNIHILRKLSLFSEENKKPED